MPVCVYACAWPESVNIHACVSVFGLRACVHVRCTICIAMCSCAPLEPKTQNSAVTKTTPHTPTTWSTHTLTVLHHLKVLRCSWSWRNRWTWWSQYPCTKKRQQHRMKSRWRVCIFGWFSYLWSMRCSESLQKCSVCLVQDAFPSFDQNRWLTVSLFRLISGISAWVCTACMQHLRSRNQEDAWPKEDLRKDSARGSVPICLLFRLKAKLLKINN